MLVLDKCVGEGMLIYLIRRFFENGFLIPVFSVWISYVFSCLVRESNLDYLKLYSENVSKVCLSVQATGVCCVCGWKTYKYIAVNGLGDSSLDYFVNRIIMWMLMVVGTWIGFGFRCKGRVERTNEIIREFNSGITFKEKVKFWKPIIIWLMLSVCILPILNYFDIKKTVTTIVASFIVTVAFIVVIVNKYDNSSEQRGLKNYNKAIEKHRNGEDSEGQVMKQHFHFVGDELVIDKRDVKYEGHQNDSEFIDLFGEKHIKFVDADAAYKMLLDRDKKQHEYIKKGVNDCDEIEKYKNIEKILGS